MSKIALLIDGGYFEKVKSRFAEKVYKEMPKIDLELLSDNICEEIDPDGERFRTYYYDSLPWVGDNPSTPDLQRRQRKQSYLDRIKMLKRFEVRYGRLQKVDLICEDCGSKKAKFNQKLVDVLISVDMVSLAWAKTVDSIAVVTGDSDFVPAVKAAKEAGAMTCLIYDPATYIHNEIKMVCDERITIDKELINKSILSA